MSLSDQERRIWKQANALFAQYLDDPPSDSGQWMDGLGVAAPVRERLVELIRADRQTHSPLDQPVFDLPDVTAGADEVDPLVGRRVGAWILQVRIGRGGMATVYQARRDTAEFEQVAAVKLLSLSLVSSRFRDHFQREQQILARLQHPNIASLLDAGLAEDGSPFLVMELVRGQRIDRYAEATELSDRSRVTLFLQVCDAVAFAQQNLIVHRDIKPTNILVDEQGTVRLLDFGIARILEDEAQEATTTRAFTPGYAAPEQEAGLPVTTATDVFALGCVLFGLLCGERPPERGAIKESDLSGLRRRDPELANIVAMAVRPEPERRYAAAANLAQDLRLWQKNRPILASPDSAAYRLGKYVRRHRVGVLVGLLVAALGIAGIASIQYQAHRARLALVEADANAEQAGAVQAFLIDMFDGADPWTHRDEPLTANELLDQALQMLPERLGGYPAQKASVMQALAEILRKLGRMDDAAVQAGGAVQLFADAGMLAPMARSKLLQANVLVDSLQLETAEVLLRQLIAETSTDVPDLVAYNMKARMDLARLFSHTGKIDEQTPMIRELLVDLPLIAEQPQHADLVGSIYASAAENFENTGQYAKAMEAAAKSEALLLEAFGPDHPWVADAVGYRATANFSLGQWDAAEQAIRQTIEILSKNYSPGHPQLLWAQNQLGRTLLAAGRYDQSLSHFRQFHQLCLDSVGEDHLRTTLALIYTGLSYQGLGQLEQARDALAVAVPLMRSQSSADNVRVGLVEGQFAAVLSELGEAEAAQRKFDESLDFMQRNAGKDHPLYAQGLISYAEHLLRYDDPQAALDILDQALPVLIQAFGPDSEFVWLANLHKGMALAGQGEDQTARELLQESLAGLKQERYQRKYHRLLDQAEQLMAGLMQ